MDVLPQQLSDWTQKTLWVSPGQSSDKGQQQAVKHQQTSKARSDFHRDCCHRCVALKGQELVSQPQVSWGDRLELGGSHFLCFSPNSLSLGVLRTAHRLLLDLSCPQPAGSTGWGNPEEEGLSKEPQTKGSCSDNPHVGSLQISWPFSFHEITKTFPHPLSPARAPALDSALLSPPVKCHVQATLARSSQCLGSYKPRLPHSGAPCYHPAPSPVALVHTRPSLAPSCSPGLWLQLLSCSVRLASLIV